MHDTATKKAAKLGQSPRKTFRGLAPDRYHAFECQWYASKKRELAKLGPMRTRLANDEV